MKNLIFVLLMIPATSMAQSVGSDASSNSNAGADAGAAAQSNVTINSSTPEQTITYKGDYKVRTAPPVGLGGFSSSFASQYCLGTAQFGLSVLGGSAVGGKPVADIVCQKMNVVDMAYRMRDAHLEEAQATTGQRSLDQRYTADKLASGAMNVLCSIPEVSDSFVKSGLCSYEVQE